MKHTRGGHGRERQRIHQGRVVEKQCIAAVHTAARRADRSDQPSSTSTSQLQVELEAQRCRPGHTGREIGPHGITKMMPRPISRPVNTVNIKY